MNKSMEEFVDLYFTGGGSDKVYQAHLADCGNDEYEVMFAFGRRGNRLKTGTKTAAPVAYFKAKKIFDQLVHSKTSRGYKPGPHYKNGIHPSGSVSSSTSSTIPAAVTKAVEESVNAPSNFSGISPQLLNFITEDQVNEYLDDRIHILQEKMDGRRTMIRIEDREASGINKKGSNIPVAEEIAKEAHQCPESVVLDGEDVDCTAWVFDILHRDGEDLTGLPYGQRFKILRDIHRAYFNDKYIKIVRTAFTPEEKRKLFNQIRDEGGEGVVLKNCDAPYVSGRPASGGDQLKFKFYETASVLVSKKNSRRSVSMQMLDGKNWIDVGNVTIPPNKDIPSAGDIIEVRYLYAFPGGSIYQPVFLGIRDDVDKNECVLGQLKYKSQTI